jgi:hypothetical protein
LAPGARSTLIGAVSAYTGLPVKSIEYREEPAGLYTVATLNGGAKSVLERWLRVAGELRSLGLVIVKWSGEANATLTELSRYLGVIFAEMSVYLSMSSSFSAIESLREDWNE